MKSILLKILFWSAMIAFAVTIGISEATISNTPCPNNYDEGDIIEHLTGNTRGVIMDCRLNEVTVDIGHETRVWRWTHVMEFQESR